MKEKMVGEIAVKEEGPLKGQEALAYIQRRLPFDSGDLNFFPKFFQIETVNSCNARCIMCGLDWSVRKPAFMNEILFAKICAEIAEHADHVEKVGLYWGGEPLLDKVLGQRISKMKATGVRDIYIASNASLLDSERATAILNAGLDQIYISFDSLKKERYESVRRNLSFDKVYKNIRDFIQLRNSLSSKLKIRLQIILQEINKDEAQDFFDHWKQFLSDTDDIVIQNVHNWGASIPVMESGSVDVNRYPCISLFGSCVVNVHGEVAMCCADVTPKVILGSLYEDTISQIWHGDKLKRLREIHLSGGRRNIPLCDGCTVWREGRRGERAHGSSPILTNEALSKIQGVL
jgi:radical SAM protein with 4Fe4S-binding SPASM domain